MSRWITTERLNHRANAAAFIYCIKCEAMLTSADDERGRCTQCDALLPRLRRLLLKVAAGYVDDPGTSDLDDIQPIHAQLDLGDWRLAKSLLRD